MAMTKPDRLQIPEGTDNVSCDRVMRWIAKWLTSGGKSVWPITHRDITCEQFVERRERGDTTEIEEA